MQSKEIKYEYQIVQLCKLSQSQKTTIPNDWKVKLIKDIVEINPQSIDENYSEKEILYVDIGSIQDYKIKKYERFFLDQRPSRAQRKVRENDIIVSTVRPYLKAFAKIEDSKPNLICSTGFAVLRPKNSEDVDFIFNYIKSHHFEVNIIRYMEGMAYPAITSNIVGNSVLPYPTNGNERIKIGSIFSVLDELIQKTDHIVQQTQRLKKGLMQRLLTNGIGHTKFRKVQLFPRYSGEVIPADWSIDKLDDLVTIIDYRGRTPPFSAVGIPHLRSNNIRDGKLNFEDLTFVSEKTYEEYMTRGIPKENDVLFTTEGPLGEVALVPKDFKFSIAQRIMILRPKSAKIIPQFLKYLLLDRKVRIRYFALATGTTLGGIASKWFIKVMLPYPNDVSEQQKISNNLDQIAKQIEYNESLLLRYKNMKKGLMQKILTGKIRVKV